jgi:putative hydrolase of the HAD superfamily
VFTPHDSRAGVPATLKGLAGSGSGDEAGAAMGPAQGRTIRGTFGGVLLDLFGTIISMGRAGARAASLRAMADALDVDRVEFVRRWSESFDDRVRGRLGSLEQTIVHVTRAMGQAPDRAKVEAAVQIRFDFHRDLFRSDAAVLRSLDALRHAGCRLAVVSDTSDETPRLWPETVLAPRFDTAVFSCVEGVRKPEAAIYRVALHRLGLDAARCAYVGDGGSRELSGAAAVGLTPFRFRFPDDDQDPADRVDPDLGWSVRELRDLSELLAPE